MTIIVRMLTKVSISVLKARLSEYLDIVKSGGDVIVTDRGKPVARLTAVGGSAELDAKTEELVRDGVIRPPSRALPADFWNRDRPKDPKGRAVSHIIDERRQGR